MKMEQWASSCELWRIVRTFVRGECIAKSFPGVDMRTQTCSDTDMHKLWFHATQF